MREFIFAIGFITMGYGLYRAKHGYPFKGWVTVFMGLALCALVS